MDSPYTGKLAKRAQFEAFSGMSSDVQKTMLSVWIKIPKYPLTILVRMNQSL